MPIPENVNLLFLDFETTGVPAREHYPIEIGMIALDRDMNELFSHERMIRWFGVTDTYNRETVWVKRWKDGYPFHKIEAAEYVEKAVTPHRLVTETLDKMRRSDPELKKRWILCSDNIQFEYQLMEKVFSATDFEWPFHYCGWDTSLFLELMDVGDPQDNPHRALADTKGLVDAVVIAVNRLNNLKRSKEVMKYAEGIERRPGTGDQEKR